VRVLIHLFYSLDGLHLKFFSKKKLRLKIYFFNRPFWLAHHQKKKKKILRLPKIAVFIWGWSASPLTYLCRWERKNFGQNIWGNLRSYSEQPWGTHGEPELISLGTCENRLWTWWEHKNSKISSPSPTPKSKKDESSHSMHTYYIPRHGCHDSFCLS
jgi:hypothetical protein